MSAAASRKHAKQEPGELRVRAVLWVVAGVIVMLLLVALIAGGLARLETPSTRVPSAAARRDATRLSSNPGDDIDAFEREKRLQLNSYGWVDRPHGIARVPIDRAMQRLSTRNPESR
ncbi:MAG: hypothetical protein ACJ8R9_10270 [Steroidobacteraceae bacterium]